MMRDIVKAVTKTGSGTIFSLLFGAATMKIIAVMAGPQGVGLFSLIRQTQQTASVIGSCGGQAAVVQGLASRDDERKTEFLEVVVGYYLLGVLFVVISVLIFSRWLGPMVFGDEIVASANIMRWIIIPSLLGIVFLFVNGVLNGFRAIGRLAISQVGAAIGVLVSVYPAMLYYEKGSRSAMVFLLALGLLAGGMCGSYFVWKGKWLKNLIWRNFFRFKSPDSSAFLVFASSTLIAGLIGTGTVLVLRAMVANIKGLALAGIFDVAWTLSMMYVMLALNSFNTYYLPTLSATFDEQDRVLLMQRLLRVSLLIMVPVITTVVALKPLVITVLYSGEFRPALDIIRWMLIGDLFKVASWILAMPMLAYADMRAFLWSELFANTFLLIGASIALHVWGSLEGIGIVFLVNYVFYLAFVLTYSCKKYKFRLTGELISLGSIGLLVVTASSWFFWTCTEINLIAVFLWICLAFFFSWRMLLSHERSAILTLVKAKVF